MWHVFNIISTIHIKGIHKQKEAICKQITTRGSCIKQVACILISTILCKIGYYWNEKNTNVSSGVNTRRGSDICEMLLYQMNKNYDSSCADAVPTCRNKTKKYLTAGVKPAFDRFSP